jgi:hypothetical protein
VSLKEWFLFVFLWPGIVWPALGVFCLGLAVWFFRPRQHIGAALWAVLGLAILGAFAAAVWVVPGDLTTAEGKPDSRTSRQGFESTFGYPPPPSVSQLRYFNTGFQGYLVLMRFHCSDRAAIDTILATKGLPTADKPKWAPYPDIEWWGEGPDSGYKQYGGDSVLHGACVWFDEAKGLAFYEEWGE